MAARRAALALSFACWFAPVAARAQPANVAAPAAALPAPPPPETPRLPRWMLAVSLVDGSLFSTGGPSPSIGFGASVAVRLADRISLNAGGVFTFGLAERFEQVGYAGKRLEVDLAPRFTLLARTLSRSHPDEAYELFLAAPVGLGWMSITPPDRNALDERIDTATAWHAGLLAGFIVYYHRVGLDIEAGYIGRSTGFSSTLTPRDGSQPPTVDRFRYWESELRLTGGGLVSF